MEEREESSSLICILSKEAWEGETWLGSRRVPVVGGNEVARERERIGS